MVNPHFFQEIPQRGAHAVPSGPARKMTPPTPIHFQAVKSRLVQQLMVESKHKHELMRESRLDLDLNGSTFQAESSTLPCKIHARKSSTINANRGTLLCKRRAKLARRSVARFTFRVARLICNNHAKQNEETVARSTGIVVRFATARRYRGMQAYQDTLIQRGTFPVSHDTMQRLCQSKRRQIFDKQEKNFLSQQFCYFRSN